MVLILLMVADPGGVDIDPTSDPRKTFQIWIRIISDFDLNFNIKVDMTELSIQFILALKIKIKKKIV